MGFFHTPIWLHLELSGEGDRLYVSVHGPCEKRAPISKMSYENSLNTLKQVTTSLKYIMNAVSHKYLLKPTRTYVNLLIYSIQCWVDELNEQVHIPRLIFPVHT